MKTTISIILSIALSAGIYYSSGDLRTFIYALTWVLTAISVLALFAGTIKGDVARRMISTAKYNWPLTFLAVAATIAAGYPILALIRLIASTAIYYEAHYFVKGDIK